MQANKLFVLLVKLCLPACIFLLHCIAVVGVVAAVVGDIVVVGAVGQLLIYLKLLFCSSTVHKRIHTMQLPKRKSQLQR